MVVNKNSNQSQELKLLFTCVLLLFYFIIAYESGQCAIGVSLYLSFAKTIVV